MLPKAVLVLVAVLSLSATAWITLTVLTVGPIAPEDRPPAGVFEVHGPADQADLSPPRLYPMLDFNLTDQDGQAFGLSDLRGKVWVADTIFTRCDAICPTLTSGLKQIQAALRLDERYPNTRLVSFSVDGGYDTAEVLKRYADAYRADPGQWYFLTGGRDVVWPLINDGLRLAVDEAEPGEDMAISHTGKLVLIDREGMIRGYYDGLNEAGRIEMLADMARVLDEE